MNARIFAGDHAAVLQPLQNVTTGQHIPNFPNTVIDLAGLNGTFFPPNKYKILI
jgi:hypothetical protein